MKHLVFHPDLSVEIKSSYDWYEDKVQGLGDEFIRELELSFEAIVEYPDMWPKFSQGFRRFILTKFPYSVIYRERQNTIFVVAVMHNSRKPGYWAERIRENI